MKKQNISLNNVTIAYFSGTGGTEYAAKCLEEQFSDKNIEVTKINIAQDQRKPDNKTNLLIILAPVYAFRLASIMERWTKMLPNIKEETYASIISVSGGGEVSPNTACRLFCKRILKEKGYRVLYENMLVMPSNFAIQAEESLNLELVRVLPKRIHEIVEDIIRGKRRQTKPYRLDKFLSVIGKAEHLGAGFFGWTIYASDKCNRCGVCVRNCPVKNIRMKNGRPKFTFHCIWCMKCIYACPHNALSPRILSFLVLKKGFNIKKMVTKSNQQIPDFRNKEYKNKEQKSKNQQSKNQQSKNQHSLIQIISKKVNHILWQGVFDYLKERGE